MTSRRTFLTTGLSALAARGFAQTSSAAEPIIDIHQHTHYHDRLDEHLLAHQKAMGITTTIILPGGITSGASAPTSAWPTTAPCPSQASACASPPHRAHVSSTACTPTVPSPS